MVCNQAFKNLPPVQIRRAFEMRKDVAQGAIENEGWSPKEGKGRGDAKRVLTDASYAELRKKLKTNE